MQIRQRLLEVVPTVLTRRNRQSITENICHVSTYIHNARLRVTCVRTGRSNIFHRRSWTLTHDLDIEFDLDMVKMNQQAEYLSRSDLAEKWLSGYKDAQTHNVYYLRYHLQTRHSARHFRPSGTPLLSRPSTRTDFAARGFRHSPPAVWNSLPRIVLDSLSLTVFQFLGLKLIYFTWQTLTNMTWPALPPPLKLRPYGGIEMCYYYYFLPSVSMFPREFKNWKCRKVVNYYYYYYYLDHYN